VFDYFINKGPDHGLLALHHKYIAGCPLEGFFAFILGYYLYRKGKYERRKTFLNR
jgi:hypothetical protein